MNEDVGFVEVCVELNHSPLVPVFVTIATAPRTALSKQPIYRVANIIYHELYAWEILVGGGLW